MRKHRAKMGERPTPARDRIINAARQIIATKPPASITMRGLASVAGVSPVSAYRHFGGVADVLDAVRAELADELAETRTIQNHSSSDDVIQRTRQLLHERIRQLHDQPSVARTLARLPHASSHARSAGNSLDVVPLEGCSDELIVLWDAVTAGSVRLAAAAEDVDSDSDVLRWPEVLCELVNHYVDALDTLPGHDRPRQRLTAPRR
ncbi:MAG: TetR/AcrR family transcriptional regulator [Actinomycetota bacterium]